MIYPKFLSGQLKKEQAIGITAPSDGTEIRLPLPPERWD